MKNNLKIKDPFAVVGSVIDYSSAKKVYCKYFALIPNSKVGTINE